MCARRPDTSEKLPVATPAPDVVDWVDSVLSDAIARHASDIHFEPYTNRLAVRYRLDGMLQEVDAVPPAWAERIIARLKVRAQLLTYRNDIPQEGRLELPDQVDPAAVGVWDQRLAVFPTVHGQRAVVRVLYEEPGLHHLDGLGLRPALQQALEHALEAHQGLILVTGPAGSGKSTTLAACLRHLQRRHPGKSVISLEDPVERLLDGVTQIEITGRDELTFPRALRSLLRQDPQIIMIGEIRDAETARIALEAALTGHLILTTMHSGHPAAALLRLLEMGAAPYQVTASVTGVLNLRLVRALCPACRADETDRCAHCLGAGYRGRVLAAEWVELGGELRAALLRQPDTDRLQAVMARHGHMTLAQDALRLVRQGLTTPQEIHSICTPDELSAAPRGREE